MCLAVSARIENLELISRLDCFTYYITTKELRYYYYFITNVANIIERKIVTMKLAGFRRLSHDHVWSAYMYIVYT
jgi:hypothetical protein